ncbi:MAG: hypothetical protein ABIO40_11820 [Devosia sp.]
MKLAIVAAVMIALPGVAGAVELRSDYTDLDISQCTNIRSDEMGGVWTCPGLKGYPVMVAEGDLRMFVSFGLNPGAEKAAEETLPPFNRLGPKIEWLSDSSDAALPPVATIIRWFTQRETGEAESQVLVVTQLKPGAVCHIAYIDATANADANALARQAAAELAGSFDCEMTMPQIEGAFAAFDLE